jgi:hypothetical protein
MFWEDPLTLAVRSNQFGESYDPVDGTIEQMEERQPRSLSRQSGTSWSLAKVRHRTALSLEDRDAERAAKEARQKSIYDERVAAEVRKEAERKRIEEERKRIEEERRQKEAERERLENIGMDVEEMYTRTIGVNREEKKPEKPLKFTKEELDEMTATSQRLRDIFAKQRAESKAKKAKTTEKDTEEIEFGTDTYEGGIVPPSNIGVRRRRGGAGNLLDVQPDEQKDEGAKKEKKPKSKKPEQGISAENILPGRTRGAERAIESRRKRSTSDDRVRLDGLSPIKRRTDIRVETFRNEYAALAEAINELTDVVGNPHKTQYKMTGKLLQEASDVNQIKKRITYLTGFSHRKEADALFKSYLETRKAEVGYREELLRAGADEKETDTSLNYSHSTDMVNLPEDKKDDDDDDLPGVQFV